MSVMDAFLERASPRASKLKQILIELTLESLHDERRKRYLEEISEKTMDRLADAKLMLVEALLAVSPVVAMVVSQIKETRTCSSLSEGEIILAVLATLHDMVRAWLDTWRG